MPKKKESKKDVSGLSAEEATEMVISLTNAGHAPSAIGIRLRDEHGVKDFRELTGKTITAVLRENKLQGEMPEDLLNMIRRSVVLYKHMAKNKKDYSAKHGYELTVSKIRRITKYYAKKNRIPAGWHYTPEEAALLVK